MFKSIWGLGKDNYRRTKLALSNIAEWVVSQWEKRLLENVSPRWWGRQALSNGSINQVKTPYGIKIFYTSKGEYDYMDVVENGRPAYDIKIGFAKQEFWVSFDRGIEGAYYGSHLDKARLQGRIGHVPHEPGLLVHTAMDIGVNESSGKTAMIWYQIAGQTVRVINCYQNHGLGVDHYIDKLMDYKKEHGYKYGYHFAPHDMKVREFGAGALTRYEQARQLGVTFRILEQIRNLSEGINTCWLNFHKIYFDETHCKSLLDALENYRAEWDEIKKRHSSHPVKNWALHYADAFRYMIQSLPLCDMKNTTPAELQKRYLSVVNPRGNEPDFTSGRY